MKQQTATFIAARPRPPEWEVHFEVEHCPLPGMYVLADLGEVVRTPLFPSSINDSGFSSVVPAGHPATTLLPGSQIDVLGPQGNGFNVNADRLLLIADVEHFPVLMPLLGSAASVSVILEAVSRLQLPSPQTFPPNVELILVTLDGSLGYLGPLESVEPAPDGLMRANLTLNELLSWSDQVCLAMDSHRYPGLAKIIYSERYNPRDNYAQAIVQSPMPCGVGVCDICRIATKSGEKHVCIDGPVFDLNQLRR
jgi:dihydroorotate dehydrogenase electron transfer subunit